MQKKILMIIRDGWGYREECTDNAICEAPTPNSDRYMATFPNTLLAASGEAVGVPEGYQGNSEVGHMTIGAGRIIFQSLVRINKAIKDGSFFKNPAFLAAIANCRKKGAKLHLAGLLQTQGVHSHIDHLFALLELCERENFHDVVIHAITDGRDAPVTESEKHIADLEDRLDALGFGTIATVSGRFYAMDRDERWDRTRKAYECIVNARCDKRFSNALELVRQCHAAGEMDEFIVPRAREGYAGLNSGDSFIFFNFRTDRTRQLTRAMIDEDFPGWKRKPLDILFVAMTQFYAGMNAKIAFEEQQLANLLGEVISNMGLSQLRISETEKYAHVTFFFNGQREEPFPGEDRILINSPKVKTYDLKPEMSVYEIKERLTREIASGKYDFIVTNLVNGDMVGHTGIPEAIRKAVAAVDDALGSLVDAGLEHGYDIMVLADHGNAEDQTPQWRTSHTTNPVPFILVSKDPMLEQAKLRSGRGLADVAPTVLDLLGIEKPEEMSGKTLIS